MPYRSCMLARSVTTDTARLRGHFAFDFSPPPAMPGAAGLCNIYFLRRINATLSTCVECYLEHIIAYIKRAARISPRRHLIRTGTRAVDYRSRSAMLFFAPAAAPPSLCTARNRNQAIPAATSRARASRIMLLVSTHSLLTPSVPWSPQESLSASCCRGACRCPRTRGKWPLAETRHRGTCSNPARSRRRP